MTKHEHDVLALVEQCLGVMTDADADLTACMQAVFTLLYLVGDASKKQGATYLHLERDLHEGIRFAKSVQAGLGDMPINVAPYTPNESN